MLECIFYVFNIHNFLLFKHLLDSNYQGLFDSKTGVEYLEVSGQAAKSA